MGKLALQSVDMALPDGKETPGLVPVHEAALPARLDEASCVLEARTFERVDYVFFRRLSDGRSSQVAAFVVDNTNQSLDENSLASLHRQLWLYGTAPLLYVTWPSRVDVLSCARGPDFWKKGRSQYYYRPAEQISVAPIDAIGTAHAIDVELAERKRRFSAFRLADGTFWDDPRNSRLARHDKAAHQELIQAIVETDQELEGDKHPELRRLLVLTVLLKYLEDRGVFPDGWFGRFHPGAETFFDVLKSERPQSVSRLLDDLRRKFNGDVFSFPADVQLTPAALGGFATLVEARTLRQQRYLWEQYAFAHLPVEVISRIYQRFVHGGRGAFYTPPMLASLLLDQAMPYETLTGKERVLDPACGSGVFLVGAFKRLVNVWRSRNEWRPLSVKVLKSILKHSIFGAELHLGAMDLAAFSLALAICDALKPDVIWNNLQFDPMVGSNLREGDFFEFAGGSWQPGNGAWPERFDVIVGNPPFESELTAPGKVVDEIAENERGELPDHQAAYLFLEQGAKLLNEAGRLCLIQPSALLYNRKAFPFRQSLFRRFQVTAIYDFTSIRNLYDGADTKTVAALVLGGKSQPAGSIDHLTFRRTLSVSQKIAFELDHYDHHRITQGSAEGDPFCWRINLLGGGRLHEISARVRSMRTLSRYIEVCIGRQRFYQFCCSIHGSKGMVSKATSIVKQDIDALPVPEHESELDFSFWEEALIDDVLRYMGSYIRLGQDSELLREKVSPEKLENYADMFCRMLGSVYGNLKSLPPIGINGLICQLFYFGDHPRATWALEGQENLLNDLIYRQDQESLRTMRTLRFYDENTFAIVKPDRLRYWIASAAIRDADETLWDLQRQGY